MSISGALKEVVVEAERRVLAILAESATAGDLDSVDQSRRVAGMLRGILDGLSDRKRKPKAVPNQMTKSAPADSTGYPRYSVRRDTLFRVAWSRKKAAEYEHRVAKRTFKEIVHAMASVAIGTDEPITAESVVSRVNQSSPIQVPQYQVYLAIGWLKSIGRIEQIGRDGYRVPENLENMIEEDWAKFQAK